MKRLLLLLPLIFVVLPWSPGAGQALNDDELRKKLAESEFRKHSGKLGDSDGIERAKAIEGLGRTGLEKAAALLVEHALKEKKPYLARLAGELAVKLDPTGACELIQKAADTSGASPLNLVILLRECEDPAAWDLLVQKFDGTQNKRVLLEVIRAVGVRKIKKGANFVKNALGGKDLDIKNAAAVAAGRMASPDFVPALLGALENSNGFHCKFAAWALGRIEDPDIFGQVHARLGSASGESGEAKAKALEGSARPKDVDALVGVLSASKSREYREAAAIALGHIAPRTPEVQEVLLARMLRDPDREVRGACWHALSRVAGADLIPQLIKRQRQKKPELAKYVYHLLGDLHVQAAAPNLLKVIINERKDFLVRQSAAINFWKTASRDQIREFEKRLESASGQFLEHGLEALGFRRNAEGLRFLLRMLKILKDGSNEEYLAEKALERMTGHFFGPDAAIWKKWFSKNPEFFTPKQAELERAKWRDDFDKENKGFRQTDETEYAVQMGLEFLARHQHPDGRFDPQRFYEMCDETPKCKREGSRFELDPVGTTALSVLAFFGAGYTPEEGKYKDVIAKALDYLMARQQANGNYLSNDLIGGYHRPLGAQAFAEAFTITGDPEYGWLSQKSLDFLTTIQNKLGGWRYRVNINTTDTSCMSWNLFALKAGQKAGLSTREIAFAGCYYVMDIYSDQVKNVREQFIDIDPEYGYEVGRNTSYTFQTGYQNPVWDTKYATVPLGIMCRIFMGWRRSHPFCIGSANKILEDLMEEIPRGENWSLYRSQREYPTYAWYYGTLAMHQMGGRYFRLWNERIRKVVPGTQAKTGCIRGSWPLWNHDIFGRVYTAAMGVLALETYYRYLPVLQD